MSALTDVLSDIAARRGAEAVKLPAVALSVTLDDNVDPSDPSTLAQPVATIEPVVHPDLEALLDATSATRRGRFSWAFGLGEDCDPSPLRVLIDNLDPKLLYAKETTETARGAVDLSGVSGRARYSGLSRALAGTPAASVLTRERCDRILNAHSYYPEPDPPGIVTVSTDGRVLWMTVRTNNLNVDENNGIPQIPLNLRPCGRAATEPKHHVAAEVVAVVGWARSRGIDVVATETLTELERTASRHVAAWPTRGRPAQATAAVGRFVAPQVRDALGVDAVPEGQALVFREVDATEVAALPKEHLAGVHQGVADVSAMTAATAVQDSALEPYQAEVVGLHLATEIGFVNALPTGMGKTVTTLAAHRRRAATTPGWRGLVIVEANVREQWALQAEEWFPEAHVVTVVSRTSNDELRKTLEDAGDAPVLAICSYALASDAAEAADPNTTVEVLEPIVAVHGGRRARHDENQLALFDVETGRTWLDPVTDGVDDVSLGSTLLSVAWHDIVADEAMGLRSTGTKLAAALWRLRANSGVATALTGTPITKGLDDLGRLLAWVRNDADLFRGHRLEKTFDMANDASVEEYQRAIGPLVVRRDKSELDGKVPELRSQVVRLDPTPSEKTLATAARQELKRVFDELVAWITFTEQTREGDEAAELAQARDALVAARGAWLGGTTLARMAASDPETLLGSGSAGAALLASQGLIAAACDDGGTKRDWCVQYCTERAAAGDRVLVFTEFATAARGLISDLTDAGVSVGGILGGGGRARDRNIEQFREGNLSVLVSTAAGERGLNLQVSNVIVHYDLPWTPDGVVQRTGRVQRLGSDVSEVDVVFPIMNGTIEERVASLVVARAVTSLRALDTSRGIAAANTELGRVLGDLAASVDIDAVEGRHADMLAITRELLSA